MPNEVIPPFSARTRGAHAQIDSDFPGNARTGLLHLIHDLVRKSYVGSWIAVARELQRIARVKPVIYNELLGDHYDRARVNAEDLLSGLAWDKVFDFSERLHGYLAKRSGNASLVEVQKHIANELNFLFVEEGLAFEFRDGRVERRGRAHTTTQVSKAEVVLGDPLLKSARGHFNKALKYFRSVSQPDPENAVKEAVCAVEATARALFPGSAGKTLGDITKTLTGNDAGQLPKAVAQTIHGLYGFRSSGEGVAHGGTTGGPVTNAIAEYVLAVAASQMILLVDLANSVEDEVPI
jgi:hypothetical protein